MLIRDNVPEGRKLDPKIKLRWYFEKIIFIVPILVFIYGFAYFFPNNPLLGSSGFEIIFIAAVILGLSVPYILVELRYRKFIYALRDKDFLIQKGLIEKIRYVIPYEKIQNVTVSRDFMEIILGIGTIHIETAAHIILDNDIILPGVSNDSNVVNELVERSKQAKEDGKNEHDYTDTMVAMMKEVVGELREIKKVIQLEHKDQPLTLREEDQSMPEVLRRTKLLYEKEPHKKKEK